MKLIYYLITKKIIVVNKILIDEFIKLIKQDIVKIHGKEPSDLFVGINNSCGPIYGFFIDEKLVSNYGYSIKYSQNGKMIREIVQLQQ